VVPNNIKLEEANSRHHSVFEYDESSPGAVAEWLAVALRSSPLIGSVARQRPPQGRRR